MPTATRPYSDSPEAVVVALAQQRESAAFAELVERRQSWLRNLMRRCCGDATLADDLAQQVFLQAWRKISRLQEPGKFGAWLKRLAINMWLQHLRKSDALNESDEMDETLSGSSEPSGIALDLDRALATLAPAIRLCVVLSYHEGMTHGEICDAAQLPLGTVKSHIRRGSKQLQTLLSDYKTSRPAEEKT